MGIKGERVVDPLVSMEEIRSSHDPTEQLSVALQAILNIFGFEKQFAAFCYDAIPPAPETRRTSRTPPCPLSHLTAALRGVLRRFSMTYGIKTIT